MLSLETRNKRAPYCRQQVQSLSFAKGDLQQNFVRDAMMSEERKKRERERARERERSPPRFYYIRKDIYIVTPPISTDNAFYLYTL